MSSKKENEKLFLSKSIYSMGILIIYSIGCSIPLYGINTSLDATGTVDAEVVLGQVLGGVNSYTVFSLGISPIMISGIIVAVVQLFRSKENKLMSSPKRMNHFRLMTLVGLALIMALIRVEQLQFVANDVMASYAKLIAIVEMITGTLIIYYLSERNKAYGIGGQTILIIVNITDSMIANIFKSDVTDVVVPVLVALVMFEIMVVMENSEKRIPVQRISIHNIYADKNYQAIKLNPIGVLPMVFATAVFMIPKIIVFALSVNFPENQAIIWASENISLDKTFGIGVYIGIIFLLNMGFSIIFLNPKEMAEQFLKSGDSIVNYHPGKKTKRYLYKNIILISFFSSVVMGLCAGTSMFLQQKGILEGGLAMLPTSMMMLTGLGCALYKEAEAIVHTDSYRAFI